MDQPSELLSTLLFHQDEYLRCFLAKRVLLTNKTDSSTILLSSQSVLQTACKHYIEDKYSWFGLKLQHLERSAISEQLSLLWPDQSCSISEGCFGDVRKHLYCKIEKVVIQEQIHFSSTSETEISRNAIMREIRALGNLHKRDTCENIISLVAFNEKNDVGPLFYIFQCKDARNLSTYLLRLLRQNRLLSQAELQQMTVCIINAFHFCAQSGVMLRDATACSFLLHASRQGKLVPKLVPSHLSCDYRPGSTVHGQWCMFL